MSTLAPNTYNNTNTSTQALYRLSPLTTEGNMCLSSCERLNYVKYSPASWDLGLFAVASLAGSAQGLSFFC